MYQLISILGLFYHAQGFLDQVTTYITKSSQQLICNQIFLKT